MKIIKYYFYDNYRVRVADYAYRATCQCDVMMITSGAEFRISNMMQDSSILRGAPTAAVVALKCRILAAEGGGGAGNTVSPLLPFRYS